jgi:hypothetical protein
VKRRLLGAALALALTGQATPGPSVGDLGWMSGRWETGDTESWTEEVWSAPRAGTMLGFSRAGHGGAIGDWEFLRIAAGEDGVPVYWGSPRGRPAVAFRMSEASATGVSFDNGTHDFPQRIRYVRTGDEMVATISKLDGSNAISWTYRRQ